MSSTFAYKYGGLFDGPRPLDDYKLPSVYDHKIQDNNNLLSSF